MHFIKDLLAYFDSLVDGIDAVLNEAVFLVVVVALLLLDGAEGGDVGGVAVLPVPAGHVS